MAIRFRLAQDDGDLFIESDTVTKVGSTILISLDRFFHERNERALAFLGRFIQADDVPVVGLHGFCNLRLERFNRHAEILIGESPKGKSDTQLRPRTNLAKDAPFRGFKT